MSIDKPPRPTNETEIAPQEKAKNILPESVLENEMRAQAQSVEAMALIHAKQFDAASEIIDAIQDTVRQNQLRSILAAERVRRQKKSPEVDIDAIAHTVRERARERIAEYDPSSDPDGREYIRTINEITLCVVDLPRDIREKINAELLEELSQKQISGPNRESAHPNTNTSNAFHSQETQRASYNAKVFQEMTGEDSTEEDGASVERQNPMGAVRAAISKEKKVFKQTQEAGLREKAQKIREAQTFEEFYKSLEEVGPIGGGLIVDSDRIQVFIEGLRKNIEFFAVTPENIQPEEVQKAKEISVKATKESLEKALAVLSEDLGLRAKAQELLFEELGTRQEARGRGGASAEPTLEEQAPAQNAEVSDEDWEDIAVALDGAQKKIEGWDAGSERNKRIKNLEKIRAVLERIHSGNEVSEAEKERTMRLVKVLVEAGVDELAFLLDEQKSAGHVDSAIPEKKEVSQETIDERTRIYDDPTEDPVYKLVVNYGNGIAQRRIEEARMDGEADVDSPEFIERANRSAEVVAWGIFSNDYPEKAAAYKNKIPVLKMVMERGMSGGESAPGKKTKQPKGSPVEAPSAAASLGEHDGLTEKIQNGEAVLSWEPGQQVRVLRPDGAVEDGWEVHVVAGDMVSIFSREKNLERTVHVSELAHWQTLDLTPVLESKEGAPPTPEAPASVAPSPKKPRAARGPKIPLPEGFKTFSQKFEADFKISEKEFLTIPGYGELTFGQRALVRERFQQVLLGKVHEDAVGTEQKIGRHASGKLSRWASGFMKSYRIADLEKGIADALSQGGIDAHRSTLEQLVATTKANADEASFDAEGNLEVSYLSGFTPENPEQEKHAKRFDEAAERLSQIPQEWSAKTATVSQKFAYWRAHRVYDSAREDMLFIKGVQEGDALKAALWMNKLDERVRMEQLLTTHPKASKELERIKDPDLWMKVLKNASVERLGYFVGGGLSRLLTVSMWGTLGAPVGAGIIGGIRAGSRAKEGLRESDMLARRGVKSKSEMAQNVIDVTKNKTAEKLDRLVDEIAAQTDYVKRSVLATRLRERVKYTQAKLEDGKVNFGVFSERVKNQLNLSQALGRASAALLEEEGFFDRAYADKLEDSVKGYVGMRDKAINKKRRRHMATAITKGAVISAGFGAAGRWASHFVFKDNFAHGLFDSNESETVRQADGGTFGGAGASRTFERAGESTIDTASTNGSGLDVVGAQELASANGGKTAESVLTNLEIGARGPEGSIIDYFKDHHDVAKKFGWDGKGDIKKWAGTRAHQLWLEHASKALENDEVKESLTKLGYTNDLEGYTKMMTRIKSGGVMLDIEHTGVTLSDMEYLKARSAGVASAEISVPEHVDAPVATPELAASAAVEGGVAQEAATVQPEHPQELTPEEADDHQRWKRGRTIVRAAPTETVSAEDVHKEALGIPFERHSNRSGAVSYNGIPYDRNPEFSRWAGPNGIPFHRSGDYLDMRGVNISAMISEHMDHDLAQVFGETPEGYNAWDDMRDEPVGRFRSLNYKPGSYGDRFKAYLDYLERESGVRPRTHILWFNEKNQNYIRRALGVIERRGLRQR